MTTSDTVDPGYADRLVRLQGARWKQVLDVQAPYRWFLRRHALGRTLEIGCGTGRILAHLDGRAVGVDHNETSVGYARSRGLAAFTPSEFSAAYSDSEPIFDTLVLGHVVEHLAPEDAADLIRSYRPYLRPRARLLLIVPQQRGFASDATHVTYFDRARLGALVSDVGAALAWTRSFPLPSFAGRAFTYNETAALGVFGN